MDVCQPVRRLSPYVYAARTRLLTTLAYRFDVFATLGTNTILMMATVFLWRTAFRGIDAVEGVGEKHMVTYAIVAVLLRAAFQCGVQDAISNRMRDGNIAMDLIKPIQPLGYWLSEDLGSVVSALAMHALPLLVVSVILLQAPLPGSSAAFLAFLASCIFSYGILWLVAAVVGTIAIWTMEIGNLGMVKDAVVGILSGSLVPLWFFPDTIQKICRWLPFQYTYQAPLGIYIGRTPPAAVGQVLLIQLAWIVVLSALLVAVWNRAKRRVLSQGG
jgi:ABC-2 type transport system permease protein